MQASCDLAALLILHYSDDVVICKKCLKIITHVLETSRHKGAIEAAGAALVKFLILHLRCRVNEIIYFFTNNYVSLDYDNYYTPCNPYLSEKTIHIYACMHIYVNM